MRKKKTFKVLLTFILIFISCSQNEELEQNSTITSNCRLIGGNDFFGNPLKKTYYCTISNREFYIYLYAARFLYLVYCGSKSNLTVPTGPFLCLVTINSAIPRSSVSG